ncbi:uncharacterized protein LOC117232984 [Bombus vosnesenskii]|uniref:Uncharacterized protein LOC117232984 n=4 Tax=Bombus TaxID=28641 RepID=A0A6J3K9H6_9HYME|nr:uncharacterized protein LOC100650123 [Bombus terrestris]XP_003487247.1 uncharacterized protein LOC100741298 [Bombus impatiens]XP_020721210.1 uncharacterized protein LOC100650123 [Bombus terrestris]XP_020721211.1 uncharacterized protein LOC100650123 [Bombus terrestris]XP_033190004.1 uncharacterized protein LOC117156773 [Bombus vancouverensis nearcticus]XP_033301330.1 uncharacterized protein LOC117206268 [Bombus bifarius]XP_033348704.1 uncharacterized protein LOC117232984 [Bombus vosnesenski
MPNENAPVCGCGVVVDLPKSRSGALSSRKLTIRISKSKGSKSDGRAAKKQQDDARGKSRSSETGSCSSVTEQARPVTKSSKHEKRLNHSRRTRSADRAESHYTYIDSGSSILGGGIRENAIAEALYATIPDTPNASANETGNSQLNAQSRSQPVYAIPSMVSPPPTYDVAISKTWQTGLPPTYEEYLCHKYAMISRSHTPPPPWSDSTTATTTPTAPNVQTRRELLASQPELREYLAQLSLSQNNERSIGHHHHHQGTVLRDSSYLSNQQVSREQVRTQQRPRAMPPRSQSESRVQQQRIATMYEDGAFCMETTALQSAFENGIALCSLM